MTRTHLLPAAYHHNLFLLLTISILVLSEMIAQGALETQSLQLLEYSCGNFVPV